MTEENHPESLARLESELHSHRSDVLRYLRRAMPRQLQRLYDAEDILQDVYFNAAVAAHTFRADDENSSRRWIFGIARNRLRELIRRQSTQKRSAVSVGESDLHFGHIIIMLEELAVYQRTPSKSAIGREMVIALDRAIGQLPTDYRSAIRLRYLEGNSVGETATQMNRSNRAVHMLCYRGMQDLKAALQGTDL